MARVARQQARLLDLPLFLLIFGVASLAMLLPAIHGVIVRDLATARAFFYCSLLGLILFGLIALTHAGRAPRHGTLGPLMSLFSAFVFLPLALAVPFYEAGAGTGFLGAYTEMVSSVTTTGATHFPDAADLSETLHLWRALVGWLGGLLMWMAASAILAPLNLGGFEVTSRAEPGRRESADVSMDAPNVRIRVLKAGNALIPVYVGLTLLLWVLLIAGGDRPIVAFCHAMSILATSGISPVGGVENGSSGVSGEAVMLLFLLFALSRLTFSKDTRSGEDSGLFADPEFRLGLAFVVIVPLFLFLRHWLGALEFVDADGPGEAARALWGSMFTVLSFLTTTGFVSGSWEDAQSWSGLSTPGLLLLGLALIGGGVATSAGGVKLLRVFALYRNGLREMERLVYPSSVSGASPPDRRLQRNGAFIAWIFFMLFAVSLALITIALALFGVSFETALIMAISGLSTTGPLLEHAGETPIRLAEIGTAPQLIFVAAMVVGRLETLAIIALLTPDLWRG